MKLKLEAFFPAEGVGIIRSGNTLRLARPPYTLQGSPNLVEASIEDAILRHGFHASQQEFDNWEEAIGFLNQQAFETRQSAGQKIPSSTSGKDILDVAPLEVIHSLLDRVEYEIIPQRLFDHAEDFLLATLTSSAQRWPEVVKRAADLLHRIKSIKKISESTVFEWTNGDVRFASLAKNPSERDLSARSADQIKRRGCLFA